MNKYNNVLRGVIAALVTAGTSAGISAQETGAQTTLEEIIVTATKRSVSIQDIPFVITAMSQEVMERAGIDSLEEFAYKVPALAISGQSNGRTQFNIRGISSGDNLRATEAVGIYFDEVPLSIALYKGRAR
jgi:iron complex outermembrane recepter protein|tara:strand:+ start:12229 stop:12621 length:393 start_codon:yes stop_codon:yes gene_type:complete